MPSGGRVVACTGCVFLYDVEDGGTAAHLSAQFAVSAATAESEGVRDEELDEEQVDGAAVTLDIAGAAAVARMRRARVLASVDLAADLSGYGPGFDRQIYEAVVAEAETLADAGQVPAAAALTKRFYAVERARSRVGCGNAFLLQQSTRLK